MSYDYSENILVQESAGHLLQNELGWEVAFAYNTEKLGENGTFGRKSYREILLARYFREALLRLAGFVQLAEQPEHMGARAPGVAAADEMDDLHKSASKKILVK